MQPSPSRKRTIDQVSPPANVAAYAASASPIPTAFSPAAMATGLSGAPGASPVGTDSPFTSALNQGSRMLSGISAPTPSSGMPMGSGYGPAQSPAQMQMQLQLQMQVQNGTMPMEVALQHMASMGRQQQNLFLQQHHRQQRHHQQQTIRPEVSLKMSLDSLLEDVLPALTRDGDAFYDAVEGSLSAEADSRQVQAKREQLLASLSNLARTLHTKGLASLPLSSDTSSKSEQDGIGAVTPSHADPAEALAKDTAALQELARDMFERRARLREAAGIITGILNDDVDVSESDSVSKAQRGGKKASVAKKTVTLALGSAASRGGSTPAHTSTAGGTPNAASPAATPAGPSR